MVVTGPEPEQVKDGCVVELCHRGEPAEFSGVLYKGEITLDKGEEVGGELHRHGGKKDKQKRENKQTREEERLYFVWSVVLSYRSGSQERGEDYHKHKRL